MRVSVVIPALNEAEAIAASIAALPAGADEIVVADGGSEDGTRASAEKAGVKVISAPRGRGPQMNAGAAASTGDAIVFLHADTRLPADAFELVRGLLANEDVAGGAFHLAINGHGSFNGPDTGHNWFYAFTARNANIRSKLLGAPYGDQAFFVKRPAFDALAGYKNIPYCEDLDFIRRLRSQGRVIIAPAAVSTSGRRWEKHGRLAVTIRNGLLFFRFWLGRL